MTQDDLVSSTEELRLVWISCHEGDDEVMRTASGSAIAKDVSGKCGMRSNPACTRTAGKASFSYPTFCCELPRKICDDVCDHDGGNAICRCHPLQNMSRLTIPNWQRCFYCPYSPDWTHRWKSWGNKYVSQYRIVKQTLSSSQSYDRKMQTWCPRHLYA